jgi:primase-polymerase (primpol)-like protein
MEKPCAYCGGGLMLVRAGSKFCSQKCGVYYRRERDRHKRSVPAIPETLTSRRRWTRADGKRPIRTNGYAASSTKPYTWASHAEVSASTAGDGMGIMLGDGVGCYDLDHCLVDGRLTDVHRQIVDEISAPILFVEVSVSGRGIHVFTDEPASHSTQGPWGGHYTHSRFIRMTGEAFDLGR